MKTLFYYLLALATSFGIRNNKTEIKNGNIHLLSIRSTETFAPSMELTDLQPIDGSGNVVYLNCVPKTANDKATGQLSVLFKVKNKSGKTITLNKIEYRLSGNGQSITKVFTGEKISNIAINNNGTYSWQNSRDYHELDDAIIFDSPFPSSLTIKLYFNGFSDPYTITKSIKSNSNNNPGNAYGFPGKEYDLGCDEFWYGYGGHGGGGQFFAYDLKVVGWDADSKKWRVTFPGKDGSKNEDYRGYGKPIYAIADGEVIDFGDGVKENKGNAGGGSGGGNFFKINNGKETMCYFHMQPGSLTKSLMKKGAKVKKGDRLGLLGNAGGSSEPHCHIQAIDDADKNGKGNLRPLNLSGIYAIDKNALSEPNPAAAWSKVDKKGLPFLDGRRCIIWPSASKPCWYPAGWAEIGRHGIAEKDYQKEFNKITGCGYYPEWVDAYDVNGKTYFNAIFRYNNKGYKVVARHDMTAAKYQDEYDNWVKKNGYRLQQIDNYNDNGKLKIAAIFIKKPGQPNQQPAYHAVSPESHQKMFEDYGNKGFVPVNVSVTSVNGKLYYSAFYEKRNVGKALLKSFLTQQEYQDLFDDMKKKKYEQVYVNAYHHGGKTRFTAIWYQHSGYESYSATRKSSSDSYQNKYEENIGKKLLTQCVTGYDEAGKPWFAALWAR